MLNFSSHFLPSLGRLTADHLLEPRFTELHTLCVIDNVGIFVIYEIGNID